MIQCANQGMAPNQVQTGSKVQSQLLELSIPLCVNALPTLFLSVGMQGGVQVQKQKYSHQDTLQWTLEVTKNLSGGRELDIG